MIYLFWYRILLNLYEHQSSFNPNMPVRGLNYFADTYREYIDRNGFDIYGEKLIRLPMPQYIVFTMGRKRNRIGSNFGFRMHFVSESGGKWLPRMQSDHD